MVGLKAVLSFFWPGTQHSTLLAGAGCHSVGQPVHAEAWSSRMSPEKPHNPPAQDGGHSREHWCHHPPSCPPLPHSSSAPRSCAPEVPQTPCAAPGTRVLALQTCLPASPLHLSPRKRLLTLRCGHLLQEALLDSSGRQNARLRALVSPGMLF